MKDIADRLKMDRQGVVAEAVADFRKERRERLRDRAGIACGDEDVVANEYRDVTCASGSLFLKAWTNWNKLQPGDPSP